MNIEKGPGPEIKTTFQGREVNEESKKIAGNWHVGYGPEAFEQASQMVQKELNSRTGADMNKPKSVYIVEGELDGQIVRRKFSPGGNIGDDINEVPEGKENEVNYFRRAYDIA